MENNLPARTDRRGIHPRVRVSVGRRQQRGSAGTSDPEHFQGILPPVIDANSRVLHLLRQPTLEECSLEFCYASCRVLIEASLSARPQNPWTASLLQDTCPSYRVELLFLRSDGVPHMKGVLPCDQRGRSWSPRFCEVQGRQHEERCLFRSSPIQASY